MSDQNRRTSRRWFEEVWNGRDTLAVSEMTTSDAVGHSEEGDMMGVGEFLAFRDRFIAAFPDLAFEVESVIAEAEETAIRWVARGTHTGDALGIPPCHKTIEIRGISWFRFENGSIVEAWDSWNQGGLMRHLQEEA